MERGVQEGRWRGMCRKEDGEGCVGRKMERDM